MSLYLYQVFYKCSESASTDYEIWMVDKLSEIQDKSKLRHSDSVYDSELNTCQGTFLYQNLLGSSNKIRI